MKWLIKMYQSWHAQLYCWPWQCAASGVSSYRLPVSRMRETLIDEQGSPQPSETFLLLTPGVTDPSFITISIMSAPREKQDTEFHLEQQRKMLSRNVNAWTARHDIALSQPCYCTLHMMLFKGFASLSYYASKCSAVDSSWRFYIPLIFHKKSCYLSIANGSSNLQKKFFTLCHRHIKQQEFIYKAIAYVPNFLRFREKMNTKQHQMHSRFHYGFKSWCYPIPLALNKRSSKHNIRPSLPQISTVQTKMAGGSGHCQPYSTICCRQQQKYKLCCVVQMVGSWRRVL